MRRRERLDDYEVFYMELPHADYMDDIEIQDDHDQQSYDAVQGLSDQQVAEIARDSMDAAGQPNRTGDDASDQTDKQ